MSGVNVFVSYAEEDRHAADALVRALSEAGMQPFSFLHIPAIAGTDFVQTIHTALEQAQFVVLLWSESSGSSEWIAHEVDTAQRHGKHIMPVLLDDDVSLPLQLASVQAIRAFNDRHGWILQVKRQIAFCVQQANGFQGGRRLQKAGSWGSLLKLGVIGAGAIGLLLASQDDKDSADKSE